jgi:anti-sigma-K factor RskA
MSTEGEFDAAGEYVLGTLTADERAVVERARLTDLKLEAEIQAWEARLAPLNERVPEMTPPADLFSRIEARLGWTSAPSAEIISLRTRIRRWQLATVATGLIAASLAAVMVLKPNLLMPQSDNRFVAVLQKDAASPAFVVTVDVTTKQLSVRQVSAEKLAGKSYELWLVNSTLPQPKSLGLVKDQGVTRGVTLAAYSPAVVESSVLAVSLEPEGGSPTGLPTGPVVFTGKLIEAAP